MGRGFRGALEWDHAWENDVVASNLARGAAGIGVASPAPRHGTGSPDSPRRGLIEQNGEGDDGDLARTVA